MSLEERKTPREGAAYWLNEKRSGDMSAHDARAFEVWLDRDPANRAAYEELERLWGLFGAVGDDPEIMAQHEHDARTFDRPARARWAGVAAASAVLTALSGWAIASSGVLDELGLFAPPAPQEFRTSVGQRTTVTLPDKSVVTLDTDTVLRMHEFRRDRRIELERGRAYFKVAKDRDRPFIVSAGGKTVRATGTAFDVRVDPTQMQVTLVEGRVRVEEKRAKGKDQQGADMRAGWRLVIGADQHWRVAPVDLDKETSWHDGRLTFFREPLAQAASEMNRYSEKKIVFRDGRIPDKVVVGVFRAGDVEGFAKAMELNKLARVTADSEDRIELAAMK